MDRGLSGTGSPERAAAAVLAAEFIMLATPALLFTPLAIARFFDLRSSTSILKRDRENVTHYSLSLCVLAALQFIYQQNENLTMVPYLEVYVPPEYFTLAAFIPMVAVSVTERYCRLQPSGLITTFVIFTSLFDLAHVRYHQESPQLPLAAEKHEICAAFLVIKATIVWLEVKRLLAGLDHCPENINNATDSFTFALQHLITFKSIQSTSTKDDKEIRDRRSQTESIQEGALRAENSSDYGSSAPKNATLYIIGMHILSIIPHLILATLQFAQYAILSTMLYYLDAGRREAIGAVYLFPLAALSMFVSTAIVNVYAGFYTRSCASCIRNVLSTALFKKSTQRPSFEHDVGDLTTFMNYDLVAIEEASHLFPILCISLAKVAFGVYVTILGTSISFGLPAGILVCCSLILCTMTLLLNSGRRNTWISRLQIRLSRTMDYFLHSMPLKLPAMDAMTSNFAERVCDARDEELWSGAKLRNIWFTVLCLAFVPTVVVPSLTFVVTYQRFDQPTLYGTLYGVTIFLPSVAGVYQFGTKVLNGCMSLARVKKFLDAPSHRYFERPSEDTATEAADQLAFSLRNASFGWMGHKDIIENITVDIPRNKTIVITGASGSGKSTLCRALAGEIPFSSGTVRSYLQTDRLSYCSQIPLFLEATIKENIIGPLPFKEGRYKEALTATQLNADITNLSLGDSTSMGGFNCNLSVGQKSRIALARALYLDSELVIFDNSLNGVDWRMERDIFHTIFGKEGILRKRGTTCIFTTHLRHHLQLGDFFIGLDTNGRIGVQGDILDFIRSASRRYQSWDMVMASSRPKVIKRIHTTSTGLPRLLPNTEWSKIKRSRNFPRTTKKVKDKTDDDKKREEETKSRQREDAKTKAKKNKDDKTKDGEENKSPTLLEKFGTALDDNESYAFPLAALCFLYLLFAHSCGTWFAFWAEDGYEGNRSYFVYYYGYVRSVEIIGLIALCSMTISCVTSVVAEIDHAGVLKAVFWRGISKYDKRLFRTGLSHLLEDLAMIDEQAQTAVMSVAASGVTILLGLSTASIARPWAAACYPLPVAALYLIQVYFSRHMRKIGEAEAESRGSLNLHQYEVLTTLSVTRPAGWVDVEYGRNQQLVENHSRHRMFNFLVQDWILGRCLLAISLICTGLMTAALHTHDLSGWYVVAIISTLGIIDGLPNLLDAYASVERVTGGMARLKSFAEVKRTDPRKPRGAMPPFGWPRGSINMSSVFSVTQYGAANNNTDTQDNQVPVQLALNNLSLKIEQGEKVALGGRSGGGKSVFVNLLRRVHQPLDICRDVQIDGQPLSRLNPEEVCESMHYLSHEMLFFPGAHSIRDHLDMHGRSTFEDCETVLQTVGLNRWLMEKGGSNDLMTPECLSHGERRLFCLARMLLRSKQRRLRGKGNGLIVMDDMEPDLDGPRCETVEKVLRREMAKCTVIMVSNRLDMASRICNRLIIMNDGRAATTGSWADLCEPDPTYPNIYHEEILAMQKARKGVGKGKGKGKAIKEDRGREILTTRQRELGKGRAKDRSISPDNPDTFIEASEPGYQVDPDGVKRQKVIITSTNTMSIWPRKRLNAVPSVSLYERPSNDERSVIRIYPMERSPRFDAHAEYIGPSRQVARLMDPNLTTDEGHALLRDMENEHQQALDEYHANNHLSLYYDEDEDDWEDVEVGHADANDTTDDEEDEEEAVVASSSAGPSSGTSSSQQAPRQQTAQQTTTQQPVTQPQPAAGNAPLPYLGGNIYVSGLDDFMSGPRLY